VSPPFDPSTAATPFSFVSNSTTIYILTSTNYAMTSLTLHAGDLMNVIGNASLYVIGSVLMQSSGATASAINISPGANLRLYVGGTNAALQQVNVSSGGNASQFEYFGLPANTNLTWQVNAEFVGTIYAPEAKLSLGGGGQNAYDYEGACVVNSITINGHVNFHFDENLKRVGPVR
jgi:Putative Ice-binding-like adhesive domain